ncbi:DEAD/DEAH box helicase, partial [bacterium]|nr:DEAD/DEAH box helicase [bacterium]
MDIFNLRDNLVNDYREYIQSFIQIQDKRIREYVEKNLEEGFLWPDPLIQMNPSFEPGERIDELVQKGILHHECSRIFRIKQRPEDSGKSLRLHRHQSDALKAAKTGGNYILTTGTGSGKSLAYIVPIVDHVLRIGSGKGIQAIIIYPMNALCNSQFGELQKFLSYGYPSGTEPVRFARYTGQERSEERDAILKNPPDILLTNYVMAELILTRPYEKKIIQAARNLKFLVLDELHIYRGRQGADVALLVRRIRDACGSPALQCIGTSATLVTPGSHKKQDGEIARAATKVFGDTFYPEMVIGEKLKKATLGTDLLSPSFVRKLKERISDTKKHPSVEYEGFVADPLSIWIEDTFGVTVDKESGQIVRACPKSL